MSKCFPLLIEHPGSTLIICENLNKITFGRSERCTVDIQCTIVSRQQCAVEKINNEWIITDTSRFKTTLVNEKTIEGGRCKVNDGDKISFANYNERYFEFHSGATNVPQLNKKRKFESSENNPLTQNLGSRCKETKVDQCHSPRITPSTSSTGLHPSTSAIGFDPGTSEETPTKENPRVKCTSSIEFNPRYTILKDKCKNLENENLKLTERLNYLRKLAEDTQKSLSALQTENKSLRDRILKEEHSKEMLSQKIQDPDNSLREWESDCKKKRKISSQEKATKEIDENIIDDIKVSSDEVSMKSNDVEGCKGGSNSNDAMKEADYYVNFDFAISPIPFVPSPPPEEVEPVDIIESKDPTSSECQTNGKDNYISGLENDLNLEAIMEQVELVFVEAENEVLIQQLEKKNQEIASLIQVKEEFRMCILEALEHELSCSICSEVIYQPVTLNCKHSFCDKCVTEWKKQKKECPVCRTKIKIQTQAISLDSFIDKMADILGGEFKEHRDEVKKERLCADKLNQSEKRKGRTRGRTRNFRAGLNPFAINVLRSLEEVIDISHTGAINLQYLQGTSRRESRRSRPAFIDLTDSPRPSASVGSSSRR